MIVDTGESWNKDENQKLCSCETTGTTPELSITATAAGKIFYDIRSDTCRSHVSEHELHYRESNHISLLSVCFLGSTSLCNLKLQSPLEVVVNQASSIRQTRGLRALRAIVCRLRARS